MLRGLRVGVLLLALGLGARRWRGRGAGQAEGEAEVLGRPTRARSSTRRRSRFAPHGLKGRELRLRATSRTFDRPEYKKLSKKGTARKGARVARLRLNSKRLDAVRSCEPRTIKVKGKGATAARFDLRRTTNRCRPRPIDLARADECDPITLETGVTAGEPLCMLPFPDDFHTAEDYTSATGRHVSFQDPAMPENSRTDVPIAAEPYDLNNGFSPGQTIVVKVPGIDTPEALDATDPIRLSALSRNRDERAAEPVVVINAKSGERWPISVEIDSTASTPEETALPDPSRAELRLRSALHRGPAKPDAGRLLLRGGARGAGRLPLLPRRPAVEGRGDQLPARAVRPRLPEPPRRRDQAVEPVPRVGLHRRERREHRRAHARRWSTTPSRIWATKISTTRPSPATRLSSR